jgi:curved DNA-binding protein CbpA
MKNHYQTLSLSQSAIHEQIKTAYTNAVLKAQGQPNFVTIFSELREAYDILSIPEQRKKYDEALHSYFEGSYNSYLANESQPDSNSHDKNLFSEMALWIVFKNKMNKVTLFYSNSFIKKVIDTICNPFLSPFRTLQLGFYRLFLAIWLIFPFLVASYVYILQDASKKNYYHDPLEKAFQAFLFMLCAYYPIARILLWVWKGFNEEIKKK